MLPHFDAEEAIAAATIVSICCAALTNRGCIPSFEPTQNASATACFVCPSRETEIPTLGVSKHQTKARSVIAKNRMLSSSRRTFAN